MSVKVIENNQVVIVGEIISKFVLSHELFGEAFYMMDVLANRLSESVDIIPVMISERLINVKEDCTGKHIRVLGQFRSYNWHEGNKSRLMLSVFTREIEFVEVDMKEINNSKINQIYLEGYICKPPIYRKTPLGREITDLLIAVNRSYGKSDYIPCICWGRNARFASGCKVGNYIEIWGRIQSREYIKKMERKEPIKMMAYEVSASKLECKE